MTHVVLSNFKRFLHDESGGTMIEYAMVCIAFVLAGFVAVSQLGADGTSLYETVTENVVKGLDDGLAFSKSY